MKIVVLGLRGFPKVQGGIETHCENLYPRLVELGCEVTVFSRIPYVGDKEYTYKGVTIKPTACPKQKFLEAFVHTRNGIREAKNLNPDILHIHAVGTSLFVPVAKRLGMKVVMTHHGPDYNRAKWNMLAKAILRRGEKEGCRNADAIISIPREIAGSIERRFSRKAELIPNGVEIPERLQTDGSLREYGLTKGKYILAVGRFVPEKGFHDLVKAAIPLGWKLVIAGKADHEDKYSRELKERAVGNPNIVLTGFITGKPLQELYSHAGLFVLPSYYEGLPIALLEAMSYGLSCIVSDISANREVGLAEERYFKPGDIKGLEAKIREFAGRPMSEEEKSCRIGQIREKYDWDKISAKTFEVYKRVISS
ncbi:MAG: glycosyltransferase family 4 protein [Candidatus Omnitrophica bacterium]|nr:glycosyltransferase family 4 protein [Candidatus Omnitrophota bacterium]